MNDMRSLKIAVPGWDGRLQNYVNALRALGAEAELVSTAEGMEQFDALLIPGGCDILPRYYREEDSGCEATDEALDKLQFAWMEYFTGEKKPVLGICRGHQLINVFFGGTLIQDLPMRKDHTEKPGGCYNAHRILIEQGSLLSAAYGPEAQVNSSHHQAVDALGKGLCITARAEDGVVEGIEHRELPVWGVQFHPERMRGEFAAADLADGDAILLAFLKKCEADR